MRDAPMLLSRTFIAFFNSEKAGSVILILCTLLSLTLANSAFGTAYDGFWQTKVAALSIEHWINDLLMAIFSGSNDLPSFTKPFSRSPAASFAGAN
jgi:Na+:H+ antiporter, NhaA family